MLVEPAQLQKTLSDPALRILDVRSMGETTKRRARKTDLVVDIYKGKEKVCTSRIPNPAVSIVKEFNRLNKETPFRAKRQTESVK